LPAFENGAADYITRRACRAPLAAAQVGRRHVLETADSLVRGYIHLAPFAVLWLSWLGYWIAAARNVKATRRREPYASRLGQVVLILLGAALLAVHPLEGLGARFLPDAPAFYWIGLLMAVAGLGFAVWARLHLGNNWSARVTVKENHELIRSGPYAIVRHPIYTGLLFAILGTAISFGEWRGLVAFAFLTVSLLLKLRTEERFMTETFPDQYPRYRAEVSALIPFVV
jgi:protein-S-isoprenylcysteine O-methyltransferase Ste14